jgi:hypothetical protein
VKSAGTQITAVISRQSVDGNCSAGPGFIEDQDIIALQTIASSSLCPLLFTSIKYPWSSSAFNPQVRTVRSSRKCTPDGGIGGVRPYIPHPEGRCWGKLPRTCM